MLVRCNPKCKMSDGMTDASLDLETNDAICNKCGETIDGVSSYLKNTMKQNKDVVRANNRKAFVFECKTCDKHVESLFLSGRLVGKSCDNGQKNCMIDVTSHMVRAVQELSEDEPSK